MYVFSVVGTVSTPSLIWPASVERPGPVLRVRGPRPSELRTGLGRVRGVHQAQVPERPGRIRDGVETVPTLREEEAKQIPVNSPSELPPCTERLVMATQSEGGGSTTPVLERTYHPEYPTLFLSCSRNGIRC